MQIRKHHFYWLSKNGTLKQSAHRGFHPLPWIRQPFIANHHLLQTLEVDHLRTNCRTRKSSLDLMNTSMNMNGPENHFHMTVNPSTNTNVCHYSVHVNWYVIYFFHFTPAGNYLLWSRHASHVFSIHKWTIAELLADTFKSKHEAWTPRYIN